jgi:hypothetical protein
MRLFWCLVLEMLGVDLGQLLVERMVCVLDSWCVAARGVGAGPQPFLHTLTQPDVLTLHLFTCGKALGNVPCETGVEVGWYLGIGWCCSVGWYFGVRWCFRVI